MMNTIDQELLATFIEQRLKMGESEWYCIPKKMSSGIVKTSDEPICTTEKIAPLQQIIPPVQVNRREAGCSSFFKEEVIGAQESLQELYDVVCGCLRCPLGKGRTHFVFGDGNPEADIMFIGEAPGAEEDLQGIPFVGRAGGLLTRMIEAIKFRRENVYIGNILKCRPPNNRDPQMNEIEKCEPILLRQIAIIQPKIICALGRISGQTLLRTKSTLGALRGKIHDYHGIKLIVTYHPAALLRNPQWKRFAWEDLKLLRREYDGTEL